jgi:hypothetical protein
MGFSHHINVKSKIEAVGNNICACKIWGSHGDDYEEYRLFGI